MIIKFTHAQSSQCSYPIGCPVWIFTQDPLYDDVSAAAATSFRQGVINSVSMNFVTKEFYYEVLIDGKDEVVSVSEEELGYASGCRVTIADQDEFGDKLRTSGTVLMCRKNGTAILYTVELDGTFQDGIEAGRVSYKGGAAAVEAQTEAPRAAMNDNVQPLPASTNEQQCKEVAVNEQMDPCEVPGAIDCHDKQEANQRLSELSTSVYGCNTQTSQYEMNTMSSTGEVEFYKEEHHKLEQHKNHLTLGIPMWVQSYKFKNSQRALFRKLVDCKILSQRFSSYKISCRLTVKVI